MKVPITEPSRQMPPTISGIQHQRDLHFAGEEDRAEQHGRDHGDGVGLEQIGRHAGAVADIVADIVRDHGWIARIVLGDAGLDLADQVGADVGALGEDAAAQAGEDRDQRGAEAEPEQPLEDGADRQVRGQVVDIVPVENAEVDRDAEQPECHHQHAGDRAGAKRDLERRRQSSLGGLRGAHVGLDRHVHADVAGGTREQRADQVAEADVEAQEDPEQDEDDDADAGDGHVLAIEIRHRAFLHGAGDLAHPGGAVRLGQDHLPGQDAIGEPDAAADQDQHVEKPIDSGHLPSNPSA